MCSAIGFFITFDKIKVMFRNLLSRIFGETKPEIEGTLQLESEEEFIKHLPPIFKRLHLQAKLIEKGNNEVNKRLSLIAQAYFYPGDFAWGFHLFDGKPEEQFFKAELEKLMPSLKKIKEIEDQQYEYFHEHYLDNKKIKFGTYREHINDQFLNNDKIKKEVLFVLDYLDEISILHN